MSNDTVVLISAAASIGFFHTLLGPDHYLPFIAMSRSGEWSMGKTSFVTIVCGIGHVISSLVLGFLGISLGLAVSKLEAFESFRGDLAAWALLAFGIAYFAWGVKKAIRNKPHTHLHSHSDGSKHLETHVHTNDHVHVHHEPGKKNMTPWLLFIIFVLGPCEPLIPVLMYPAAKESLSTLWLVTVIFGAVTVTTMLGVVLIGSYGISVIHTARFERYTHAIAGAIITFSGISILFFGL